MAHNIDETTGAPAIAYIGSTPWHSLGTRITPTQARDLDFVRKAAGLDFFVEARSLAYQHDGQWLATPRGQATVRTDTNAVLGIVGPSYTVVQNEQALDVLRPAVEQLGLTVAVAGALNGGSTGWALAQLPQSVDVTGTGDTVNGYALFRWSHDGSVGIVGSLTPVRVVCQNTLNAALNNRAQASVIKVRHTASAEVKLDAAARVVSSLTEALIGTGETFTQLAHRRLSQREVIAYIESVFPQEGDKLSDVVKARRATVAQLLESGVGANLASPDGPTAWGAYNAVTEYFDHVRPAEAKSVSGRQRANESALFGANHDAKRFALTQARELVAA
jgi:phage/plasmid-like protein (TIGR03299 family)